MTARYKTYTALGTVLTLTLTGAYLTYNTQKTNFSDGSDILEALNPSDAYTIAYENNVPSIYFSSTIENPSKYVELVKYITTHKKIKEMNFYLAGNGGSVTSVLHLVNAMRLSDTKFNMIVYGDVYSAHAVLAVNGHSLTVANDSIMFLFHEPAIQKNGEYVIPSQICKDLKGTDRGISQEEKCYDFMDKTGKAFEDIAMKKAFYYMSKEQIEKYHKGYDVIIPWKELKANNKAS